LSLVVVRKRSSLTSFHQTPLGSPSLLQVSTELEEAQNTHYGEREDLPFDLRHKAGPIQFNLRLSWKMSE